MVDFSYKKYIRISPSFPNLVDGSIKVRKYFIIVHYELFSVLFSTVCGFWGLRSGPNQGSASGLRWVTSVPRPSLLYP